MAPDEIRVDQVPADEEQDQRRCIQFPVDGVFPALAGYEVAVVPLTYQSLSLEEGQRARQVVTVALVFVGIRIEDGDRPGRWWHATGLHETGIERELDSSMRKVGV